MQQAKVRRGEHDRWAEHSRSLIQTEDVIKCLLLITQETLTVKKLTNTLSSVWEEYFSLLCEYYFNTRMFICNLVTFQQYNYTCCSHILAQSHRLMLACFVFDVYYKYSALIGNVFVSIVVKWRSFFCFSYWNLCRWIMLSYIINKLFFFFRNWGIKVNINGCILVMVFQNVLSGTEWYREQLELEQGFSTETAEWRLFLSTCWLSI